MEDYTLDSYMMNEIIVDLVGRQWVELYDLLPKKFNGTSNCDDYTANWKKGLDFTIVKAIWLSFRSYLP